MRIRDFEMGKIKNWSVYKGDKQNGFVDDKYWVHDFLIGDAYATTGRTNVAVVNVTGRKDSGFDAFLDVEERNHSNQTDALDSVRQMMKKYAQEEIVEELLKNVRDVLGYSKKDARALFDNQIVQGVPGELKFPNLIGDSTSFMISRPAQADNEMFEVSAFYVPEGTQSIMDENETMEQDTYVIMKQTGRNDTTTMAFTDQEEFVENFERELEEMI